MEDPYSVLGLYPDCTYEEAKAAYRKAALLHHPDRHPPARKPEAERRFRILAQAFQQVCNDLGRPIDPAQFPSTGVSKSPPTVSKKSTTTTNHRPSSALSLSSSKSPAIQKTITDKLDRKSHSGKSLARAPSSGPPTQKSSHQVYDEPDPESFFYQDDELEPALSADSYPSTLASYSSRSGLSRPDLNLSDDHPTRTQPPLNRRSSFSHAGDENSYNHPHRTLINTHDIPYGSKDLPRQSKSRNHGQLYNIDQGRRDKDWDFGFGDDFFSSGADRFGPMSAMMGNITSGFDSMMSSAFQSLSMAGPDPAELARIDGESNCTMRMRQSKMVMGRTEDGSWAGKRMEKQMNMANGRLEVNENAQDIRLGGRSSRGGDSHPYPSTNSNMRGNAEDWDPPPAYQRGEAGYGANEAYQEPDLDGYQPAYHHPVGRLGSNPAYVQAGPGPRNRTASALGVHRDMIPTRARHGSLSHMSRPTLPGEGGHYDDMGYPRGLSSRLDYGSEVGYHPRPMPMSRHDLALGPPSGRAMVRRASGEISTRF